MPGVTLENKIKVEWPEAENGMELYWHPKTDTIFLKTGEFEEKGLHIVGGLHSGMVDMHVYSCDKKYYISTPAHSFCYYVFLAKLKHLDITCELADETVGIVENTDLPTLYRLQFPDEADVAAFIFYFGEVIEKRDIDDNFNFYPPS